MTYLKPSWTPQYKHLQRLDYLFFVLNSKLLLLTWMTTLHHNNNVRGYHCICLHVYIFISKWVFCIKSISTYIYILTYLFCNKKTTQNVWFDLNNKKCNVRKLHHGSNLTEPRFCEWWVWCHEYPCIVSAFGETYNKTYLATH